MNPDAILEITREALFLTLIVSAPPIVVSLVVGVIISVFQAATQIQEQTLTFVPKTLLVFLTLMLIGGWMLNSLIRFTSVMFGQLPRIGL